MNIKELMTGDFVICKNNPNKYLKIFDILTYRKRVFGEIDGMGVTEEIDNLEGIPLTQKILENNGFIEILKHIFKETATHMYVYGKNGEYEDGFLICGNDEYGYYLGVNEHDYPVFVGKYSTSKDPNLMGYAYPAYNAKYVHQLQNILNSFELDSEIIL